FLELRADAAAGRNDCTPSAEQPNRWQCSTRDPWMIWPVELNAAEFRFFLAVLSCSTDAPQPFGQLFWSGPLRPGFNESLSLRFPVQPDGRFDTYLLDLHAGADPGALNHLWWHRGSIEAVRLDPMDAPGEFTIARAGFVPL